MLKNAPQVTPAFVICTIEGFPDCKYASGERLWYFGSLKSRLRPLVKMRNDARRETVFLAAGVAEGVAVLAAGADEGVAESDDC